MVSHAFGGCFGFVGTRQGPSEANVGSMQFKMGLTRSHQNTCRLYYRKGVCHAVRQQTTPLHIASETKPRKCILGSISVMCVLGNLVDRHKLISPYVQTSQLQPLTNEPLPLTTLKHDRQFCFALLAYVHLVKIFELEVFASAGLDGSTIGTLKE